MEVLPIATRRAYLEIIFNRLQEKNKMTGTLSILMVIKMHSN